MSSNSAISEVYFELANAHPWTLIIFALIYTMLAIVGIFLNLSVVYVTIRTKSMNKSTNKLLAIYSFFEIVHQFGHFLFTYSVISGQYLMPYKIVIRIITPSIFAVCCTTFLLFFTSIDRLFYVIFPLKQPPNVLFYVAASLFIGFLNVFSIYAKSCDSEDETLVTGTMNDIGMIYQCTNSPEFIWPTIINVILLTTIVLYAVVAFYSSRKSQSNSNAHQINIRIFQTLFVIVSVNIGGYLLKFIEILILIPMLANDIMALWKLNQIFGILLNISAASNAPILYFTSKDYRKAFDKEWQLIIKLFNKNSVQPY
uniref:G-protein coupled receptors family 1 profile domain-containing protein n=1 Tax=Globodera rostochiensis TaxID=31243 RepID=A0A914H682_GLORO